SSHLNKNSSTSIKPFCIEQITIGWLIIVLLISIAIRSASTFNTDLCHLTHTSLTHIRSSLQILSESFLKAYGKDIINIHHGLLPSFKGGNPSRQAFNAGVKLIGATSHFVTQELDAGPIIEQMVERVSHRDTLQSFVVKSENLEKQCLTEAIKSYCELGVLPYELKKTVVF
ncbi:formyltetrahydrofolate deformylase 1, mitochondrial-like, partial [Miscanthus floridulus]|uniref:formyltetrahydrofolate deformylase 1, mitochondrial-like n=1 Tax=Miscanthus floridulus TaxID=154761 RepID=UPI0034581C04